jgi:proline dehydrogenase
MLFRSLILRAAGLKPVQSFMRGSRLVRPLVRRFVAGESQTEALRVAEELAQRGFGVSLDLLGENVADEESAARSLTAYLGLVEAIGSSPQADQINVSIKLTALGLDQGADLAEQNYRRLLAAAEPLETFVRADMEGSDYTERTIAMVERVYPEYPHTGTVLQSYLHRTDDDLRRLIALGSRIRLVKGAYLEPAAIAYQDKDKVDSQYLEQAKRLLCEGNYPAIATHDEAIIRKLTAFIEQNRIDKSRYEWQMLYGIRRDLQASLLEQGHRVRVYVPFGSEWYPYFTRRLAERPANLFFIAKSLMRR